MALGFMRRHRRWLHVFLWIVIASFGIFFIPGYRALDETGNAEAVAEVGGQRIQVGEFQRAYAERRGQVEEMYQGRLDTATLRSLHIEEQVLDELVTRQVLKLEAQRLGVTVDDETLMRAIQANPSLQKNGQFVGVEELQRRARIGGLSLKDIEVRFREGLQQERLQGLVTDAVSVNEAEVEREYRRRNEQVKLEYVQVNASAFRASTVVTEAEALAHFQAAGDAYKLPERRVVSYVLVEPQALRARVTVTDGETEIYYREHQEEFRQQEQVCASHILIKTKTSPDATAGHGDDEALALTKVLLEKIRQGADFATVAKQSSEDESTAPNGGDLSCFGRGRMVREFENAAFDLAVGSPSEPVKTPYGYHIIRLSAKQGASIPGITQVRERIREQLAQAQVRRRQQEIVESLSAALADKTKLAVAAQKHGLTPQKSAAFARGETPDPLTAPALIARAFTLKVSEADPQGAVTRGGHAFIELAEIQAPRQPEFKEVQARVTEDLMDARTRGAARDKVNALRAQAQKDGLERAAVAAGYVRKETPGLVGREQALGDLGSSAALDEAAFGLPDATLSEPVSTPSGWALLRVLERKPYDRAAFEKEKETLTTQLRDERRRRLFQAYLQQARQRYKIERRPDVLRRLIG
jgi:peptidyl-prolyl cis-trans isomerase D